MLKYFILPLMLSLISCISCSVPEEKPEEKPVEEKVLPLKEADFGSFLAGVFARTEHDMPQAARYYAKAYEKDPTNVSLMTSGYLFYALSGNMEKAVPLAEETLALNPEDDAARYILIARDIHDGHYQKALDSMSILRLEGFARILVPLMQSWSYAALQNKEKAEEVLLSLTKEKEFLPFYHFHRALLADYLADTDNAEKYYELAAQSGSRTIKMMLMRYAFFKKNLLLDEHPEFLADYLNMRHSSLLTDTFLQHPTLEETLLTPKTGIAESFFSISATFGQAKSLDVALLMARLAIYLNQDSDLTQMLTAELLEEYGRYEDANRIYAPLTKKPYLSLLASVKTVQNFIHLKQYDKAVNILKEQIKKHPDVATLYYSLGESELSIGHFKEAEQALTKCLLLANKEDAFRYVIYMMRSMAYTELGKKEKALSDLEEALKLSPDNPIILNALGYAMLEERKEMDKAMTMIKRALEISGDNGAMLDSLGWGYLLMGDYEKAVQNLETASLYSAGNALIASHLADAYYLVGRKREASFQWERSLLLKEDQSEALQKEVKQKLKTGYQAEKAVSHKKNH